MIFQENVNRTADITPNWRCNLLVKEKKATKTLLLICHPHSLLSFFLIVILKNATRLYGHKLRGNPSLPSFPHPLPAFAGTGFAGIWGNLEI
jgi:hypothetical protein